jgi:hypothetical protein
METFKVGTFNFYMVTLLVYMDLCHQTAYKVTIDIITMVRTPLPLFCSTSSSTIVLEDEWEGDLVHGEITPP